MAQPLNLRITVDTTDLGDLPKKVKSSTDEANETTRRALRDTKAMYKAMFDEIAANDKEAKRQQIEYQKEVAQQEKRLRADSVSMYKAMFDQIDDESRKALQEAKTVEDLKYKTALAVAGQFENLSVRKWQQEIAWYNKQKAALAGQNSALEALEALHVERMNAINARAVNGSKELSAHFKDGAGFMVRYGQQVQNIGYQVSDFATQVSMGTSALRAFGQQAPQVLQAFGPWGSIIGAGVGIVAGFAGALIGAKTATKELKEELTSLPWGEVSGRINLATAAVNEHAAAVKHLNETNYGDEMSVIADSYAAGQGKLNDAFLKQLDMTETDFRAKYKDLEHFRVMMADLTNQKLVDLQMELDRAKLNEMEDGYKKSYAIQEFENRKAELNLKRYYENEIAQKKTTAELVPIIEKEMQDAIAKQREIGEENLRNIKDKPVNGGKTNKEWFSGMQSETQMSADYRAQLKRNEEEVNKHLDRINAAHKKEQEEAIREDEKRTENYYKAVQQLEDAQATSEYAKLKLKQSREIHFTGQTEAEKTAIKKRHEIERLNLEKSNAEISKQIALSTIGTSVAALQELAGKNAAFFLMEKSLAAAEVIINTQAAVAKVGSQAGIFGIPIAAMYEAQMGASLALIAAQTITGFAKGTDNAPPGMAWVGEQGPELVQFRGGERVYSNSQSRGIANSFGGDSITLNIHITPTVGMSSSEAESHGRNAGRAAIAELERYGQLKRQASRRRVQEYA